MHEARITSRLEHPGIVPVYEIGERPDGSRYYTMKFVRGRSLSAAVKEAADVHARLALLPNFVALCNAIAYAHSHGVVHRDIKPANVMLGRFGETLVIDWGLSKFRGDDAERSASADAFSGDFGDLNVDQTQDGEIIGTPAYMPPEQALGKMEEVDERSDVYSLGAVLYEILTGRPPFSGRSGVEVLRHVIQDTPEPINRIEPVIPPELAAICNRAMRKNAQDRYASAKVLADEVSRFLSGALVQAYDYRPVDHLFRFIARHRAIVVSAAAAVMALLVLGAVSYLSILNARDREHELRVAAEIAQTREAAARNLAEQSSYQAGIFLADGFIKDGEYLDAVETLWRTPESLRGWEWGHLLMRCNADRRTFRSTQGSVLTAQYSPDGSRIALGYTRNGAALIDAASGETVLRLGETFKDWTTATLNSDGSLLMTAQMDAGIRVFDTVTGETVHTFRPIHHTDLGHRAAINRDGTRIVQLVDLDGGGLIVWNLDTNDTAFETQLEGESLNCVAFNTSGSEFALGAESGAIVVLDIHDGKELQRFTAPAKISDLQYTPDDAYLLTGESDGAVRVWDRASGQLLRSITLHDVPTYAVSVHPRGSTVVASFSDGSIAAADIQSGTIIGRLQGHTGIVYDVSYDSTGDRIVTASADGTVRVWDSSAMLVRDTFKTNSRAVRVVDFSPDGNTILALPWEVSATHTYLQLFDRASLSEAARFGGFIQGTQVARFSPDGRSIVVGAINKTVYVLDAATGRIEAELLGHKDGIKDVRYSPDGSLILSISHDLTGKLWDAATGKLLHTLTGHTDVVNRCAFIPDGSAVVTVSEDATARFWSVATGETIATLDMPDSERLGAVTVEPNGQFVWFGGGNARITKYDRNQNRIVQQLAAHSGPVLELSVSPDGSRLLSSGMDSSVRVFETATGNELIRFEVPARVYAVAWSPDGTAIAHAAEDGSVTLRYAHPWRLDRLPGDTGATWQTRYEQYKRAAAVYMPVEPKPPIHLVSTTEAAVRKRLIALASLLESAPDLWHDGILVDPDRVYPVCKLFAADPGDKIVQLNERPLTDAVHAAAMLRQIADTTPLSLSFQVDRDGMARIVQFDLRTPRRSTDNKVLPRMIASMSVSAVEDLRTEADEFQQIQRDAFEDQDLLPSDGRLDGLWINPVHVQLGNAQKEQWATVMNQFLGIVGLYVGDHVLSINGKPIDSIHVVLDAMAESRHAVLGDQPYTYRLEVERTQFEIVDLNVNVE